MGIVSFFLQLQMHFNLVQNKIIMFSANRKAKPCTRHSTQNDTTHRFRNSSGRFRTIHRHEIRKRWTVQNGSELLHTQELYPELLELSRTKWFYSYEIVLNGSGRFRTISHGYGEIVLDGSELFLIMVICSCFSHV